MPSFPELGVTQKPKNHALVIAIVAALAGAGGGALYVFKKGPAPEPSAAEKPIVADEPALAVAPTNGTVAVPAAPVATTVDATPTPTPTPAAPTAVATPPPPAPSAIAPAAEAPAVAAAPAPGKKVLAIKIGGPLEGDIVRAVGKTVGAPLTQVTTRALVWWLSVPGDFKRGDELSVIYEEVSGREPVVHAVRYKSEKFGKTFEAYRFQNEGDAFSRLYKPDGEEMEQRLVDGPLDSWEQVTSLLRDGRRHKGVDFKTPVGTPVKATFDGVVARRNWNFRGNGNCVEIAERGGSGRSALYLHLSEVAPSVRDGQVIHKGQVLGRSGNTGHSFAPHLHYQLMRGEKVVDPFESHKTYCAKLDAAGKARLDAEVKRLSALWPPVAQLAAR